MKFVFLLLIIPAVLLWGGALVFSLRSFYSVRYGRQWAAMADVRVWFSEARANAVFEKKGLEYRRLALRFLLLFLGYCIFLFLVLVVVGAIANSHAV